MTRRKKNFNFILLHASYFYNKVLIEPHESHYSEEHLLVSEILIFILLSVYFCSQPAHTYDKVLKILRGKIIKKKFLQFSI